MTAEKEENPEARTKPAPERSSLLPQSGFSIPNYSALKNSTFWVANCSLKTEVSC
jgi:hypothetical protein